MYSECNGYNDQQEEANWNMKEQEERPRGYVRQNSAILTMNISHECKESFQAHNMRKTYRELNIFRKGFKLAINIYKNSKGIIVVGREEINNRWKEFFQQLLNGRNIQGKEKRQSNPLLDDKNRNKEDIPPTLEEVAKLIGLLKNNKAPRKDNISAELIKYGGIVAIKSLQKII